MFSSKGLLVLSLLSVGLLGGTLPAAAYAASSDADVASKLKADYVVSHVGTSGLKYDYNRILQPGSVLAVRIDGIYADLASTPQAIVGTVITNNVAQQQRGLLSALSSTNQGRMLRVGEQVYLTKMDVKPDSVRFELLTAGTALPRYRAEVRFAIPDLNNKQPAEVEQIISAALSSKPVSGTGNDDQRSHPPQDASPHRSTSRPGVAAISPEQEQRIATQLSHAPAGVSKQVADATETLKSFIGLNSCIFDYSGKSQLQAYLGPHGDLNAVNPPYVALHYHDKESCLDVIRIQGWSALSLNAVQFQVVYTAADSGESVARTDTMQKEPDGTWLMNN